jgi:hypothetical protein
MHSDSIGRKYPVSSAIANAFPSDKAIEIRKMAIYA